MRKDEFDGLIQGYVNFDCPRTLSCCSVRGSGGVSVFIKSWMIEHKLITRIYHEYNDCVVLFISKASCLFSSDVVLLFTYIAPENSPVYDLQNSNGVDILKEKMSAIQSDLGEVNFLLAGDFNARISDLQDYILHDDIGFIYDRSSDYPGDTFCIPRNNCDTVLNKY